MADIVTLPSGIVTINDDNYRDFVDDPRINGKRKARGLKPRLFTTHPQGCYSVAPALAIDLIEPDEMPDRIRQQEKDQASLQHIRDQGMFGKSIPSRDQANYGYCWGHSTVSAMLAVRASNNLPYADLSAYAICCIIKNFRNEGGWNGESLEFATKRGCPTSKTWPQQGVSRSFDNKATWEEAANYTVQEWWDLSESRSMAKKELATLLLLNIPVMIDLNWWGHSVCAVRLLSWSPFKVLIWNSWGESWSERGMGVLEGERAVPDGAACPRVLRAA